MSFASSPYCNPDNQPECDIEHLQELTRKLRVDVLNMIYEAQSGHPGSSFSCIDIIASIWSMVMRHDSSKPDWPDRDRFVLSKGHAAPALYAVLMHEGYIPYEEIHTFRQINSNLQGHPASKYVKGVDISTGSLGQGLSAAVGMALGLSLNKSDAHVYCLIGDGEAQEGQIWEAALSASGHKVNNLTAICDRNRLQIDGSTEDIKPLGDIAKKFEAFGWYVQEIKGHDFQQILESLNGSKKIARKNKQPVMIVAHTTKGKGVSFMENEAEWHGKAPNEEQYKKALQELGPEIYHSRLKQEA